MEVMRELQKHQDHNSCITVSALLTRCLRAWRYPDAYPLTVRVSIYNATAREWMERNGIPRTDAEIADFNQSGSAHVYIGYTPENLLPQNHWSGHLAVIVPHLFGDRHGLVDLTVMQANKPEWGIELPPMILKVTDNFLAGTKPCSTTVRGCQVIYEAFPDDKSYNKIGHWKKIPKLREMADRIVERLAG